jgi:hypothetical protein
MDNVKSRDFHENFELLAKWYKKRLDNDQMEIWFNRVGWYPDRALTYIVDEIIETQKFFPVPNEFRRLYNVWKEANPDISKTAEVFCPECGGTGFFYYRKFDSFYKRDVDRCAYCKHCENWKRYTNNAKGEWFTDRREIKAKGLKFKFTFDEKMMLHTKRKDQYNVGQLTERMFEQDDIPF